MATINRSNVRQTSLVTIVALTVVLLATTGYLAYEQFLFLKSSTPEIEKAVHEDARYSSWLFGFPPLDTLFKSVHYLFFKLFLQKNIHFWFLETWFFACTALMTYQQIDFDRYGLLGAPIYMFLYQYGGVGVFWPLVMIYYLWKRHTHKQPLQSGNVPTRVIFLIAGALSLCILMTALQMLNRDSTIYFHTVNTFLLVPVFCMPLLSIFLPSERAPRSPAASSKGQLYLIICFAIIAAVSFVIYWRWLPELLFEYQNEGLDFAMTALKQLTSNPAQRFLMFDCLASLIVMGVFLLVDGGFSAFAFFVLFSPALSPGACIGLYFVRRDLHLVLLSASSEKKHQ